MKEFNTKEDAQEWMLAEVDDPCVDGERFSFTDDVTAMEEYAEIHAGGCCGFFDELITVNGKSAWIGCNYGH